MEKNGENQQVNQIHGKSYVSEEVEGLVPRHLKVDAEGVRLRPIVDLVVQHFCRDQIEIG